MRKCALAMSAHKRSPLKTALVVAKPEWQHKQSKGWKPRVGTGSGESELPKHVHVSGLIKFLPRILKLRWSQKAPVLAWATITKYHRLGGLNNSRLFCCSSGGWKSKIKVSAGLVSPGASLLGIRCHCLSVFTWSSLCVYLCLDLLFLERHPSD